MTKLNGHTNGSGNGHDRENVTSLEEARKRASVKLNAASQMKQPAKRIAARDLIWGGLLIAMAIGFVVSFVMGASGPINGGSV